MVGEDDAALAQGMQRRHHVSRDVVRAQAIDDDEQLPMGGRR
jgi:hypothetical protein